MEPVHRAKRRERRTWRLATDASRAAAVLMLVCLAACEVPAVQWVDELAVATSVASPLTHPPRVMIDSTMRDTSPTADRLLVQDLLRETTVATLLLPHVLPMPEAQSVSAGIGGSSSGVPPGDGPRAVAAMDPAMHAGMAMPDVATALGDGDAPLDSLRCARSLRMALAPGRGRVAVWWSRRERSRVRLVAAWRDTMPASAQLGAWRGPIIVDSLDQGPGDAQAESRGAAGCSREAPSVVVDDAHGYVHVGYALTGPEGSGVFYAHQMDPRAGFEVPQAIVYGERLGAVRVAAQGDVVAVAYDDPNGGERPRIGLAISTTSGHLFTDRLVASSAIANARDPFVVLRGRAIVVGWSETPTGGGEPTFLVRRAVVRSP